jgi:hypothetical protein
MPRHAHAALEKGSDVNTDLPDAFQQSFYCFIGQRIV